MPYTEKYPLNPTPQGDSTKEAVLKNREEIKTIGNALSAQSKGGGSGLRQRILYGKNSGGKYSFLSGDGLSVIIDGSNVPVVLTLADGFNENGAKDYVETINKKISAWTLPGNTTSYLFVERSLSGALSYDSVTIKPVFADSLSSGIPMDSHIFNTLEQKMYMYNGAEWKAVVRVFIAAVTTNSTDVTKIEYMNNAAALEMTAVEKEKLSGIAEGAEVNQNAFSVVKTGDKEFSAAVKQAVLEFIAGNNIDISLDNTTGKLTIKVDGTVPAAQKAINDNDGNNISATYLSKAKADNKYYSGGKEIPFSHDNEFNFPKDVNNVWFGFRGKKVKDSYCFGNGSEGGLANIIAKNFCGNINSGHFDSTNEMNDWIKNHYADNNTEGFVTHRAYGININGREQWGTVLSSMYPTNDGRALLVQMFFANSTGIFIRFINTPSDIDNTNNWYKLSGVNNDQKLQIGENYLWFE